MNVVLSWEYVETGNKLLDYIASVDFKDRAAIAIDLKVSVKTVGRWISELKKDKLLVVHRYSNNNFIYMVGRDADNEWDKYEAIEIAKYRKYPDILNSGLTSNECKEVARELPLFSSDSRMLPSCAGKGFVAHPVAESLVISPEEAAELDYIVDKLVDGFNDSM